MAATNEFVPAPGLLPGLVSSTTGYASTGLPEGLHRGLPSPFLTLIFALDDPIVASFDPDAVRSGAAAGADIVAGGLHTAPAYVRQPSAQIGIQLAIHPLAARCLFGAPAAQLGVPVEQGEAVLGTPAERLRQRLAEMPDWATRFAELQRFLRHRVGDTDATIGVRPEIVEAWKWLARHRGNGSIEGLAGHVLLSPRQLRTLFVSELGIGPKSVNQLMRFQHAVHACSAAISRGSAPDLSRIAADVGYFDHSHLTREFRRYTGTTPTDWLSEEYGNLTAGGHRNGDAGLRPEPPDDSAETSKRAEG